jgi:hypothetical protein
MVGVSLRLLDSGRIIAADIGWRDIVQVENGAGRGLLIGEETPFLKRHFDARAPGFASVVIVNVIART